MLAMHVSMHIHTCIGLGVEAIQYPSRLLLRVLCCKRPRLCALTRTINGIGLYC